MNNGSLDSLRLRCYYCHESGHIAPNCPTAENYVDDRNKRFKIELSKTFNVALIFIEILKKKIMANKVYERTQKEMKRTKATPSNKDPSSIENDEESKASLEQKANCGSGIEGADVFPMRTDLHTPFEVGASLKGKHEKAKGKKYKEGNASGLLFDNDNDSKRNTKKKGGSVCGDYSKKGHEKERENDLFYGGGENKELGYGETKETVKRKLSDPLSAEPPKQQNGYMLSGSKRNKKPKIASTFFRTQNEAGSKVDFGNPQQMATLPIKTYSNFAEIEEEKSPNNAGAEAGNLITPMKTEISTHQGRLLVSEHAENWNRKVRIKRSQIAPVETYQKELYTLHETERELIKNEDDTKK